MLSDKVYEAVLAQNSGDKRNCVIVPPPLSASVGSELSVPPLPKKARYDSNRISQPAKLQQLHIDTSMTQARLKVQCSTLSHQ